MKVSPCKTEIEGRSRTGPRKLSLIGQGDIVQDMRKGESSSECHGLLQGRTDGLKMPHENKTGSFQRRTPTAKH
ncbi:hypothetical protein I79_016249 [Cricetulus griseus]|uniref:Uncharacterized protein n=1 Tax=Cricetulus griseus TaxID=10029 RepID=G3HYV7_CRIGR|nr:hypothetical protein I79_016249 [Cricetulus griseus]